jgi:hypothetical protein
MSIQDRIIAVLKSNPDGLDDDLLAEALSLSQRTQANSRCIKLAHEGLVERRAVEGKIRSFWIGGTAVPTLGDAGTSKTGIANALKPWFWEGNVVSALVSHLRLPGHDWKIERVANIEKGEHGADIKATRHGQILVVEVKGYPSKFYEKGPKMGKLKRANPRTQARHWLAEAIITGLLRQSEGQATQVAIGFPKFDVYEDILARIRPSISQLGLMVLTIDEFKVVKVVQDGTRIAQP